MYQGFVKVAAAIPTVKIADCKTNAEKILELIQEAENQEVEIVCFPELSITACSCGDLFHNSDLLKSAENALNFLLEKTAELQVISIIGMPFRVDNQLFNCAVVFQKGQILAVIPKTYISNNKEEHRCFTSGNDIYSEIFPVFGTKIIMKSTNFSFSVEICEDLLAVVPPSSEQVLAGSHIIFNLSAFNELVGKNEYIKNLVLQQSGRCAAGYVYVSAGFGESSTDLLFASSAIIAENGYMLAEGKRLSLDKQLIISEIDIERLKTDRLKNDSFKNNNLSCCFKQIDFEVFNNKKFKLSREIPKYPFVPAEKDLEERCREIFNIQANALVVRLFNTGIKKSVIGISGGLDSTLALLATVAAFDIMKIPRKNIVGITMPGFGTTARTKSNSLKLMDSLQIDGREISIEKAVLQHFQDIKQDIDNKDITYENSQARERMQILMDIANKEGGLVIGTGDMSELALGWTTYNGDHMSMYGINSGVPKTIIKHLIKWIAANNKDEKTAKILFDVLDTPISPELLPHKNNEIIQKTEDLIGPYELHDFFLYYFVRFGFSFEKILFLAENAFKQVYQKEEIKKWLKVFINRFFSQQFKRSCLPDGVKVGSVNLSPRGGWRMPSDALNRL